MVARWSTGMEDGMVGEAMEEEVEVEVVVGDVVSEGMEEGMVVEICNGTQDITMVMVHQDHCLPRVVVVDEVEEGDVEAVVVRVSHPMVHSRKVLETTRALILRFFCKTLALVNKKSCPFSTLIKALFFTWRICVVRDL